MANESPSVHGLTVAACIGTFNQSQYLREAIKSALAQTRSFTEIWVSDDCSTDETSEIIAEFKGASCQIYYHRHPVNIGPAQNLSWVLSQPATDLVVRLDSDDRLEPKYVEILAALMEKYPDAGYAHCNVWETDIDSKRSRARILSRSHTFENGEKAIKSNSAGLRSAANCMMFRKRAIEQANYYLLHPDWKASEDWDLALRMALNGWGNVFSPEFLSNYRQWEDPLGARAHRKIQEVYTNTYIFKNVLIPEYQKRGWDIVPLKKTMRAKAVTFADALDSPRFTSKEKSIYKAYLKDLGDSPTLKLAFLIAAVGLNPLRRIVKRSKIYVKDRLKAYLRSRR